MFDRDRQIIKADGTVQPFKWDKFEKSLTRSKASDLVVDKLKKQLDKSLPDLFSSDKLRLKVSKYLVKHQPISAVHYGAREAIMKLGPAGYGFELFIAQIFETLGYHANVGAIIQGKCVSHEIDVMASKDGVVDLVECKFHNSFGIKSDVKISMYVNSRFIDLRDAWETNGVQGKQFGHGWLATNTKLTEDAYTFANCRGVKVISWNQPDDLSLRDLINNTRLIPITALKTLNQGQIELLINSGVVTCQQLLKTNTQIIGINNEKLHQACMEASLCINND